MIPDIEQILTGYMKGEYTLSGAVDLMQRHIDLAGYDIAKQAERRELFKQVVLALTPALTKDGWSGLQAYYIQQAESYTEAILSAADEFAKKGEG